MKNGTLDRLSGVIFVLLGLAVLAGALAMPRFESRGAFLYQAPGLTPAILGAALALSGLIMVLRRPAAGADDSTVWDEIFGDPVNRRRALAALALTILYGAVLFGWLPFVPATGVFIFAFVVTFERLLPEGDALPPATRTLSVAALLAIAAAFGIHFVFQSVLLVQLP